LGDIKSWRNLAKKGAMMVKMGSCEGVNMKSSINDKWHLRAINKLMSVERRGPLTPNKNPRKEIEKSRFGGL